MEQLFKLTELEARVPLNMTVLSKGQVPQVLGLGQVLQEWLDHRKVVLRRRSEHRLKQIEHRLEIIEIRCFYGRVYIIGNPSPYTTMFI